jgi:hypothetical protein
MPKFAPAPGGKSPVLRKVRRIPAGCDSCLSGGSGFYNSEQFENRRLITR